MNKHWRGLTTLTLVLLLTVVGCGPSATPTPSIVQVTKVVETAEVVVEAACEKIEFKIRTDKVTAGGIQATGTLTKCGTPLPNVEIKGKNLDTSQTGSAKTDKNGQVKIGNLIGGRVMEGHRIQIEFTVDGKKYIKCFKAIVEDNVDWSEIPCPPTPTP